MSNRETGHIAGIDGLRGLAVLAVLVHHAGFSRGLSGGFTGVDVFFVISGFVIARSIHRREYNGFGTYLSGFYRRRVLRLLPAVVLCLLVTIALQTLFIPSAWLSSTMPRTGYMAFFGLSNFELAANGGGYFSPKVELNPFLHTWSLAVEEQFYLVFPLLFLPWLPNRQMNGFKLKLLRLLMVGAALLSLLWCIRETGLNRERAYYLLPSRFWEMAAGAFVFLASLHFNKRSFPPLFFRMLTGLGLLIVAAGFIFSVDSQFPYPWALLPVLGASLALLGLQDPKGSPILEWSPLVQLGRMSYSLYLWHWPIAVLFRWTWGFESPLSKVLYFGLSILLAYLSFRFVESPFRRNQILRRWPHRVILLGGVAVLGAALGISLLMENHRGSLGLSVTNNAYEWKSRYYRRDVQEMDPELSISTRGHRIFALGDSHASAYRTMLNIVSTRLGMEVTAIEQGGCAVAGLQKPMENIDGGLEFYRSSLEQIRDTAVPGDVIVLASLRMPELADQFEVLDLSLIDKDYFSEESGWARQAALEEADRVITDLEALGLKVIFEAPLPVLRVPLYRCSDWFNRKNPLAAPGTHMDRSLLLKYRKPVMESIAILQERHPELTVWDPFPVLCDQEITSAYDSDGQPKFFDGDHLSGHGNRMLAPSFERTLLDLYHR